MRITRLAPIGLAVLLVGATCVTRFDRRGEAGPWVGELVNHNGYRTSVYETSITVTDTNGVDAGPTILTFCPTELEPRESGSFEVRLANPPSVGLVAPLTAPVPSIAGYLGNFFEQPRAELRPSLVSMDVSTASAVVEVINASDSTAYPNGRVCGIARDSTGAIVSVSAPAELPNLEPGDHAMHTLSFSTLEGATRIDVHARAADAHIVSRSDDGSRVFDLNHFLVTLPREWRYYPLQGIDSFVGRFASDDGAEMYFDLGGYTGSPDHFNDPAYQITHEQIDGLDATIILPKNNQTGDASVSISGIALRAGQPAGAAILMSGRNLTHLQQQQALAIFRSIDFVVQ